MTNRSSVERAAATLRGSGVWWAVAGGWAIDLWVGRQTREHHDVEVAVRRDDQVSVWASLHGDWELSSIAPPGSGWRPWAADSWLSHPSFQCKARSAAFEFDLFLESGDDEDWIFRRDDRVRRPLGEVTATASGIPVVRPEIQLLYMAKSEDAKNEHDFAVAAPALDLPASEWLRHALALVHPHHRWIDRLPRA